MIDCLRVVNGIKMVKIPLLILFCKLFDSLKSRIPVKVAHWALSSTAWNTAYACSIAITTSCALTTALRSRYARPPRASSALPFAQLFSRRQVIQTKGRCDSKKNQIFRAAEILALESERKAHVKECGSLASGCP